MSRFKAKLASEGGVVGLASATVLGGVASMRLKCTARRRESQTVIPWQILTLTLTHPLNLQADNKITITSRSSLRRAPSLGASEEAAEDAPGNPGQQSDSQEPP